MLLKTLNSRDLLFYGVDEELDQLLLRDLSLKRKVLVLGSTSRLERIKGIDYVSNQETIKRVINSLEYLGELEPYQIVYDTCGVWSISTFVYPKCIVRVDSNNTRRIKRVTKEELVAEIQTSNCINFHLKREEDIIYK